MNDIIDVEYREITDLTDMSTEELANGANLYWSQMELLGRMGLELAAKAGDNLLEIKSRLKHGEWEDWAKENLKFSLRKANYMMKLSKEMRENNWNFAKTKTFADIEISKVWALLGAPEDVRETIMENPDIKEMSAREFKEEIKRLKEESKEKDSQLDKAADAVLAAERKVTELTNEISRLEKELDETVPDNTEELEMTKVELEKVKIELEKAKGKLDKEKEARKKEKDKTDQLIDAAKAEAEESLRVKLEAENKNKLELLQMQYADAMKEVETLEKKLANNQQEDLAVFKVNASRLQEDFNACIASIEKVAADDPEQAAKMKAALGKVMNAMTGRIG